MKSLFRNSLSASATKSRKARAHMGEFKFFSPPTSSATLAPMTLEDHAGDIIKKARMHAKAAPEAVAQAAGISPAALAQVEETGQVAAGMNFAAIGKLLGIDGVKLDRIAKGWLPEPVDLGQWRELRVITTTSGYSVNAFLVWDEITREARN